MLRRFESDSRLPWVITALILAAGWSTSGLIFRHIEEADAAQVVFYRSLCLSTAVTAFVAFRYRISTVRAFRGIGWPGLIGAAGLGLASVTFIMAIERTTIANLSFLIATVPFFAGGLAWILMREAMSRRTMTASAVAMAGVVLMVGEGFAGGSWSGNVLALACAFFASVYAVAARFGRGRDLIPGVAVAGVIAAVTVVPLIDSLSITLHDFALCLLQGVFVSALCNGLFTRCARHLPAAELTLLSMLESVLAPLWVFIFLAEIPSMITMIGGAVIMAAISFQAFLPRRSAPPQGQG